MKKQSYASVALAIFLVAAFAGIWRLQQHIDAHLGALAEEQDEVVLRSPALVKFLSLEYSPLLADIYWTRVVQYYGIKRVRHDADLASLWPLLDITTTLDPNLLVAYRFGATFLSEAQPQGAGRPDLAVQLIQRGIRNNPDYWRFYEDLGFVYYIDEKDYTRASQAFLEGSRKPGAQIWMKVMAAKIASEGESFDTSMFLWTETYNSASDPQVKRNALEHMQTLHAAEDCRQLNLLADAYEKQTGSRPRRIANLIESGLLRVPAPPTDPLGFAYVVDETGKVQTSPASPLHQQQPPLQSQK